MDYFASLAVVSGFGSRNRKPYRDVFAALNTTVTVIERCLDEVPAPMLRDAITSLLDVIKAAEKTQRNPRSIEELNTQLGSLSGILKSISNEYHSDVAPDLDTHIAKFTSDIAKVADTWGYLRSQSTFLSVLTRNYDAFSIIAIRRAIERAIQTFQLAGRESADQRNLGKIRRLEDADFRSSNNPLNILHPHVADARYNSTSQMKHARCFEGTRTDLLQNIFEWADDPMAKPVYWLSGGAGTGKTTIALTVAERFDKQGKLGASFFFSRNDSTRSDPNLIFPTLAYQLACFNNVFSSRISDSVRDHPDACSSSLQAQMESLIAEPLRGAIVVPCTIFMVIDAIDECADKLLAQEMLGLLASIIPTLPFCLKLFITSRPVSHIRSKFKESSMVPITNTFQLDDIDISVVRHDIGLYLGHHLRGVGENMLGDHSWPSQPELDYLIERARGLFIRASLAIGYIGDKIRREPRQRLGKLLAGKPLKVPDDLTDDGHSTSTWSQPEIAETSGSLPWQATHDDCVSSVAISSDGKLVVSGSWDHSVSLWDGLSGNRIAHFQDHSQEISAVGFSTDGKFMVSGSYDKSIRVRSQSDIGIWDSVTLNVHSDAVSAMVTSYLHGEDCIISGSWDTTLRICNLIGDEIATLRGHESTVSSISTSSDGCRIASSSWDNTIRVWDTRKFSLLVTINTEGVGEVADIAFSADGTYILSGHDDDVIRRWDLQSQNQMDDQRGELGSLERLTVSGNGLTAVSIGGKDRSLQIWDLSSTTTRIFKPGVQSPGEGITYTSLAISPDSQFVVLGCGNGKVERWAMDDIVGSDVGDHQETRSSLHDSSTRAIMQEPTQLLGKLNQKADNVKYCAQQIFLVLHDSKSLIGQMNIEFQVLHDSSELSEKSDCLLKLAHDAIELRRLLAGLDPILDITSTYSDFSSLKQNALNLRSLVYWIHQRPYFKDIRKDWEAEYADMLKFDIDKLIERLLTAALLDRDSESLFNEMHLSSQNQNDSSQSVPPDPYELLTQLLTTFQWSQERTNFTRAILLEAAMRVQYLLTQASQSDPHLKGTNDLDITKKIAAILSDIQRIMADAALNPLNADYTLSDIHLRWSSIAVAQAPEFISGADLFHLLEAIAEIRPSAPI